MRSILQKLKDKTKAIKKVPHHSAKPTPNKTSLREVCKKSPSHFVRTDAAEAIQAKKPAKVEEIEISVQPAEEIKQEETMDEFLKQQTPQTQPTEVKISATPGLNLAEGNKTETESLHSVHPVL